MQDFNYHSHTYRCRHADQDMTDEEYVLEYIKMGFKRIAFTDHCPQKNKIDTRTHMRMEYNERIEYLDTIKKLKEKYKDKIEIQTGYEVEYLPGEEENLKELKAEVDKIILGQHFIYDENNMLKIFHNTSTVFSDEELMQYTEYIEKAMQANIPDIIAHPDLYMLGREEFGTIESKIAEKICESAEKYNIPLEINLGHISTKVYYENNGLNNLNDEKKKEILSEIKYPCKGFWDIATKYNIKVLYGIDVHHRNQILYWNGLTKIANEIIGKDTLEKLEFKNF